MGRSTRVSACVLASALLALAAARARAACAVRDEFGVLDGRPVYRYTLAADGAGVAVQVIEYGATLTSVRAPDRAGAVDDVLLGFDTLDGYLGKNNPYFGATVGRVANRVGDARFMLDSVEYRLYPNNGKHSLHGGKIGFDKKHWTSKMDDGQVVMQYTSKDGEEGYPGQVTATVRYWLTKDGTLGIEYNATATKRTPINLTNHAYFNLAGQDKGATALEKHTVMINSDYVTETDDDFIPTGKLAAVEGTASNLRAAKILGEVMPLTNINGFDFNYVLNQSTLETSTPAAIVKDPVSGRRMEMRTTQVGVQFYTSNSLEGVTGKGGAVYGRHAALCLEAQNWPDAVNHKEFPNSVYGPGDAYHHITQYKFSVH